MCAILFSLHMHAVSAIFAMVPRIRLKLIDHYALPPPAFQALEVEDVMHGI